MKLMSLCVAVAMLTFASVTQAAPPIDFVSVVRNADGKAIPDLPAKFTVDIIADIHGENILYSETHQLVTDGNGSVRLMIGEGTPVYGDFDEIDWNGDRFVSVKVEGEGATPYHTQGIMSIMSVPVAMQAKTADEIKVNIGGGSKTLKINNEGELYWQSETVGQPNYDLKKAPEQLYFIGSFNTWNVAEALPMTRESQYVFSIEKELEKGEIFKFVKQQDWKAGIDWSGKGSAIDVPNDMQESGNTPAFNGLNGMYKITVDFYSYTLTITAL